jgi:hypothetical protein
MNECAPVLLFAYKRPDHIAKVVKGLTANPPIEYTDIFVYIDGPKDGDTTVSVLQNQMKEWLEKQLADHCARLTIVHREKNLGLAANIINGVSDVIQTYARVIVLEDDSIPSRDFLDYMNRALTTYNADKRIFSISAYSPPEMADSGGDADVFLNRRNSSYAWATWSDRWETVDWSILDTGVPKISRAERRRLNSPAYNMYEMLQLQAEGKINSWAIRFDYSMYLNRAFSITPFRSYIKNIGDDASGEHERSRRTCQVDLSLAIKEPKLPINLEFEDGIQHEYRQTFQKNIMFRIAKFFYNRLRAVKYK